MDIEGILNKLRDESNYLVDCNDGSAYKELYANEINTLLEHIDDLESRCQAVIDFIYKSLEMKIIINNKETKILGYNQGLYKILEILEKGRTDVHPEKEDENEFSSKEGGK